MAGLAGLELTRVQDPYSSMKYTAVRARSRSKKLLRASVMMLSNVSLCPPIMCIVRVSRSRPDDFSSSSLLRSTIIQLPRCRMRLVPEGTSITSSCFCVLPPSESIDDAPMRRRDVSTENLFQPVSRERRRGKEERKRGRERGIG